MHASFFHNQTWNKQQKKTLSSFINNNIFLGEDRGDSRRKEKNAAIINTTDIYPQGVVVVEIPEKKNNGSDSGKDGNEYI